MDRPDRDGLKELASSLRVRSIRRSFSLRLVPSALPAPLSMDRQGRRRSRCAPNWMPCERSRRDRYRRHGGDRRGDRRRRLQPQRGETARPSGLHLQGRHRARSGRGHELSRARARPTRSPCSPSRRAAPWSNPGRPSTWRSSWRARPARREDRSSMAAGEEARDPRRGARKDISELTCSCWRSRAIASSSTPSSRLEHASRSIPPATSPVRSWRRSGSGIDALIGTAAPQALCPHAPSGDRRRVSQPLDPQLQTSEAVKEAGIDA